MALVWRVFGATAVAVAAGLWYRSCVEHIPPGFVAVAFHTLRGVVYRVVRARDTATFCKPLAAAVSPHTMTVLLPEALLDSGLGCALATSVENATLATGLVVTVRLEMAFYVEEHELPRYLTCHGAAQPHTAIAAAVATALRAVLSHVDDAELLLSPTRRQRSLDGPLGDAVRAALYRDCGVRLAHFGVAAAAETKSA